jgi:hypothetical protein
MLIIASSWQVSKPKSKSSKSIAAQILRFNFENITQKFNVPIDFEVWHWRVAGKQPFKAHQKGPINFSKSLNATCNVTTQEWGWAIKIIYQQLWEKLNEERRLLKILHLAQGENEEWRIGAPLWLPVLNGTLPIEWVRQPMSCDWGNQCLQGQLMPMWCRGNQCLPKNLAGGSSPVDPPSWARLRITVFEMDLSWLDLYKQ